ncbi:MAG: hypothetical protein ACREV8_08345, partial [Gammaproteobacteria bacterium]
LSLGLTQPALSAPNSVVILQCSLTGTAFLVTAGSDGQGVRNVDIGNSCALELEEYLEDGFILRSVLNGQGGSIITYTLIVPS